MKIKRWIQGMKLNIKFTSVIILFTMVPIFTLTMILFYDMRQNMIQERVGQMEHARAQSEEAVRTNMGTVDMTTRLFLADTGLIRVLNSAAEGERLTAEELLEFQNTSIASLERMVYNNPMLYGVRVYDQTDQVQEIMPILYHNSRMQKLSWGTEEEPAGWYLDYQDTIFSGLVSGHDEGLVALVTPVYDYQNGCIGVVETAVTMERMFPELYENSEFEWSCFRTENGEFYFGQEEQEDNRELLDELLSRRAMGDSGETYYEQVGGSKYVVSYIPLKEMNGTLISVQDITGAVRRLDTLQNIFIAVMLVVLVLLAYLVNRLVKRMLHQFHLLLNTMHTVQRGDLNARTEQLTGDETGELSLQFNRMLDQIQKLMKENIEREVLAKNSEIRALQNQINAHFIYNVLESIKMMAEIDEEYVISDAITALGKLLRYSMKWTSGNVLVREELEYIRNYMALINLRFDYEIYLSLNLPELVLDQEIPKMTLQPIVENAILHGIEELAEDTNIYIKGRIQENDCFIEITDAGRGMSDGELEHLQKKIAGEIEVAGGSKGNGIGLKNVQDRIRMAFGNSYGLQIASRMGLYTKVTVHIPIRAGNGKAQ